MRLDSTPSDICDALRWPASILQGLPGSALPHNRGAQAAEPVWLEHCFVLSPVLAEMSIVSIGLKISCERELGRVACALGEAWLRTKPTIRGSIPWQISTSLWSWTALLAGSSA